MKITKTCMLCRRVTSKEIPDELMDAIIHYEMGNGYIQDIPLDVSTREFIKTGMCDKCQKIFDEMEGEYA